MTRQCVNEELAFYLGGMMRLLVASPEFTRAWPVGDSHHENLSLPHKFRAPFLINRPGLRLHSRKGINRSVKIAGEVSGRLGVHIESRSAILFDRHQSGERRLFQPLQ